jgi:acyl-CoA synthetase (AMP-forming)/AMP-acid ligase II
MTLAELLIRGARLSATGSIWRYGERSTGYREFVSRIARIAGGLGELGLRPGDRVVLDVPNCPEFLELLWASLWAGLVAVPVNWHLHASEIEYLVGDCAASAILVR